MTTVHPFTDAPTPTTCTWVKQCLIPFADGVFPGWINRDQYGDKAIRADDAVLIAKVPPQDAPAGHGIGFVLWPDTPAQLTAAELAGFIRSASGSQDRIAPAGPLIPGPWHPPVDYPCNCITPDFPPVAPVPVMADAAVMLMTALAAFWLWGRK